MGAGEGRALQLEPCDLCESVWYLDESGLLQDMARPGWCVSGANRRKPSVAPCTIGEQWLFGITSEDRRKADDGHAIQPWFVIKSHFAPDVCIGVMPGAEHTVVGRSCALVPRTADVPGNLFWRPSHVARVTPGPPSE